MPVFDHGYKIWQGPRLGSLHRVLAIPKFAYMEFFSRRAFIMGFTSAWLLFLVTLGYIYLLINSEFLFIFNIPPRLFKPLHAGYFQTYIIIQFGWCFLFAFQLGSGLISRDLLHNAAVLFLSKPIGIWEYFVGKFLTLFSLFMLLTWFQAIFLFLLWTFLAPEESEWRIHFWRLNVWLIASITAYSAVLSTVLSLVVLAISSVAKNARYAGTALAAYIFGSGILAGVTAQILDDKSYLHLSPIRCAHEFGDYLFLIHLTSYEFYLLSVDAIAGLRPTICESFLLSLDAIGSLLLPGLIALLVLNRRLTSAARYGR